MADDSRKHIRRDGEIMERPPGRPERLAQKVICRWFSIIAVNILELGRELVKGFLIHFSMMLQTVSRPLPQLLKAPPRLGDSNDRDIEVTMLDQFVQSGENLLIGEVSSGTEKNESIGIFFAHLISPVLRSDNTTIEGTKILHRPFLSRVSVIIEREQTTKYINILTWGEMIQSSPLGKQRKQNSFSTMRHPSLCSLVNK